MSAGAFWVLSARIRSLSFCFSGLSVAGFYVFILSWVSVLLFGTVRGFGGLVFRYVGDYCMFLLPLSCSGPCTHSCS